jgi:membrane-bound lytic murein transglycosylase A
MQTIRDWLIAHPQRQREIMDQNESYVFFKLSPGNEMAKGAIGLPLTKLRSVAIDDDRAAYGVPTYIDTTIMDYASRSAVPLQRLFVSQDTGGALHGPHRGDLFFGRGTAEEWQAGHQNARGNAYWLVPSAPAAPTELPAPAIEPPVEPTLAADTPPPQAVAPVVVPATASQLAPIIVPKPAVSGR